MSGHTATHRVLSAHDEFEARASEDEMKRAAASAAAARTASFVQTTLLHSGLDGIIGLKKCLLSRLINSTASSISIMPLHKMMRLHDTPISYFGGCQYGRIFYGIPKFVSTELKYL